MTTTDAPPTGAATSQIHPPQHHPPRQEKNVTGATVWLTGLPSAGKTTLAREVAALLAADGHRTEVLDGDEIRTFLSAGLGFERADRDTNVQRIGFVAELLASHGVTVLVPVIAPYADSRAAVRERHAKNGTPTWRCTSPLRWRSAPSVT